jgi:hypothetical protein
MRAPVRLLCAVLSGRPVADQGDQGAEDRRYVRQYSRSKSDAEPGSYPLDLGFGGRLVY